MKPQFWFCVVTWNGTIDAEFSSYCTLRGTAHSLTPACHVHSHLYTHSFILTFLSLSLFSHLRLTLPNIFSKILIYALCVKFIILYANYTYIYLVTFIQIFYCQHSCFSTAPNVIMSKYREHLFLSFINTISFNFKNFNFNHASHFYYFPVSHPHAFLPHPRFTIW